MQFLGRKNPSIRCIHIGDIDGTDLHALSATRMSNKEFFWGKCDCTQHNRDLQYCYLMLMLICTQSFRQSNLR
jgi:hypothetical protein